MSVLGPQFSLFVVLTYLFVVFPCLTFVLGSEVGNFQIEMVFCFNLVDLFANVSMDWQTV